MGNCQAVDAAALVVQHPGGKIERHYWPISARDVMKSNPGYYVSLIIPLPASGGSSDLQGSPPAPEKKTIRYTRVKLLRPTDTLLLGHAYRLITSQEVMKVLRAKRNSKTKKSNPPEENISSERQDSGEGVKIEQEQVKAASTRLRSWRPSLQSISEASS
ncbi:hypothetical protein V2J09_015414 [Rumex salicifolius]